MRCYGYRSEMYILERKPSRFVFWRSDLVLRRYWELGGERRQKQKLWMSNSAVKPEFDLCYFREFPEAENWQLFFFTSPKLTTFLSRQKQNHNRVSQCFPDNKIKQNFDVYLDTIKREKPTGIKGDFILSTYLNTPLARSELWVAGDRQSDKPIGL